MQAWQTSCPRRCYGWRFNWKLTTILKNVVLEAAVFDGKSVRKTSSRLNLRSESSSRFEKGINNDTVLEALDFAAAMLQELANGTVLAGRVQADLLIQSQSKFLQALTT